MSLMRQYKRMIQKDPISDINTKLGRIGAAINYLRFNLWPSYTILGANWGLQTNIALHENFWDCSTVGAPVAESAFFFHFMVPDYDNVYRLTTVTPLLYLSGALTTGADYTVYMRSSGANARAIQTSIGTGTGVTTSGAESDTPITCNFVISKTAYEFRVGFICLSISAFNQAANRYNFLGIQVELEKSSKVLV